MNDEISAETMLSPFHYLFGTVDAAYIKLPALMSDATAANAFVKSLDDNLRILRDAATRHQTSRQAKRMEDNLAVPAQYQIGDFVLVKYDSSKFKPSKLHPRYLGPYEVMSSYKSDVECKHLVMGSLSTFHMDRIKPFFGSRDEAYRVALIDYNQYVIRAITAYRGDPEVRTTTSFEVAFEDDTVVWLPYNPDLAASIPFEEYCRSHPPLFPLIFSDKEFRSRRAAMRKQPINTLQPGDFIFVDLRAWGAEFYSLLQLPDSDHALYVVECECKRWAGRSSLHIDVHCPLFDVVFMWDAYCVHRYGGYLAYDVSKMVLVDATFCKQHPQVLK
jgi:hypothetical protein